MRTPAIARAALIALLFAFAGVLALRQETPADASFHYLRIHAVMIGFQGNEDVQYVELRMAEGGQTQTAGKVLCIFNHSGVPVGRFTFQSNHTLSSDAGSSILIGTLVMDSIWPHTLDEAFSVGTITTIPPGQIFLSAPLPIAGKIAFGSDTADVPAEMCADGFNVIDSVAYGSEYTGTADFGTKFASDIPVNAGQVLQLTGPLCGPCTRNNSTDYSLVDVTMAANFPRNNAGDTAALGTPPRTMGDFNCDSEVTPDDAVGALGQAAEVVTAPCIGAQTDVNCNGQHDALDGLEILRYWLDVGRLTPPPQGCANIGSPVLPPP